MREITVGGIRASDVGKRVVVLHDGVTAEGMLETVWTSWDKYAKPDPGPRCRIVVEADNVEVNISKLPMDFLLQIDDGEEQ